MTMIQQLEDLANAATKCPDWCEDLNCADPFEPGNGALHRADVANVGTMSTYVTRWTGIDQAPTETYAWLRHNGETVVEVLTAQDCRDAATVLLATADRLDELERQERNA